MAEKVLQYDTFKKKKKVEKIGREIQKFLRTTRHFLHFCALLNVSVTLGYSKYYLRSFQITMIKASDRKKAVKTIMRRYSGPSSMF